MMVTGPVSPWVTGAASDGSTAAADPIGAFGEVLERLRLGGETVEDPIAAFGDGTESAETPVDAAEPDDSADAEASASDDDPADPSRGVTIAWQTVAVPPVPQEIVDVPPSSGNRESAPQEGAVAPIEAADPRLEIAPQGATEWQPAPAQHVAVADLPDAVPQSSAPVETKAAPVAAPTPDVVAAEPAPTKSRARAVQQLSQIEELTAAESQSTDAVKANGPLATIEIDVNVAAQREPAAPAPVERAGTAAGPVADPVAGTGTGKAQTASTLIAQLPGSTGMNAQQHHEGSAAFSGGSSNGEAGSARHEYVRRAFAQAAALEPSPGPKRAPIPHVPEAVSAIVTPAAVPSQPLEVAAPADVAAPMPAPQAEAAVPQIVRAMRTQFRDGIGEAQIRLNPQHLGEVRIELKVEGDRVSAALQVERPEVRQAIESNSHTLRAQLAAQGLNLEDLTITASDRPREQRGDADDPRRQQERPYQEKRQKRQAPDREFELNE